MLKQIISFPYQLVHALRCIFNFNQKKLPRPVISIGNISFGGTGKTPVTIAIAKYLAESGLRVCVLSRGYKSQNKNFPLIINSFQRDLPDVKLTGDEPLEMLEAFKEAGLEVVVALDPNRYRAGNKVLEKNDIDVFILDDGLQHIGLHRDIEIILKNINENGFFREFSWAEKKADYLLHTKVNEAWLAKNPDKNAVVFNLSLTKKLHYEKEIGVFTAIQDYKTLVKMIENFVKKDSSFSAVMPINIKNFPDHHFFSLDEVTQALSLGINIITTHKDLTKIPVQLRDKFVVAKLSLGFTPEGFPSMLRTKVMGLLDSMGDKKNDTGSRE